MILIWSVSTKKQILIHSP